MSADVKESMRNLYRLVAGLYEGLEKDLEKKKARGELRATCRVGCNWCCYEWLEVTPAEALLVAGAIHALPPEIKAKVKANWARWKENLGDLPPTTTVENAMATSEALMKNPRKTRRNLIRRSEKIGTKMKRAALRTNTPCPLLVDGKCSIYEGRPWNCRGYFATSDPADCKEIGKAMIVTVGDFRQNLQRMVEGDEVLEEYTANLELYYPLETLVHSVERIFGPILDLD